MVIFMLWRSDETQALSSVSAHNQMPLQHQMKQAIFPKGKQTILWFPQHKRRTWKRLPNFFKLQSISILDILI